MKILPKAGDCVIVPDPDNDDLWENTFIGRVKSISSGIAAVIDQDDQITDVELSRLIKLINQEPEPGKSVCDLGDIKFTIDRHSGTVSLQTEIINGGDPDDGLRIALDALGALILAQASHGIDISSNFYKGCLQEALDAILEHIPEN